MSRNAGRTPAPQNLAPFKEISYQVFSLEAFFDEARDANLRSRGIPARIN
jgi:hypothetical protein